jgi:hypothetical protein
MSTLYASKAVTLAKAEIGYLEKASKSQLDSKTANSGHNNYDKYARDLDAANWFNGNKQGYDWCTSFVSWIFYQLANKNVKVAKGLCYQPTNSSQNYAAGCGFARNYYKNNNAFYTSKPKIGDQIFFDWSGRKGANGVDHTGIVVNVDSSKVYTVEGNTYSGNKEGVFSHTYDLNNIYIVGYGRPKYDSETKSSASTTPTTATTSTTKTTTQTSSTSSSKTLAVTTTYQIYSGGKWCSANYVGDGKNPIKAIAIKASKGTLKYRVHIKGSGWLPYVTGYNTNDFNNGYAGDKKGEIDAVEVCYTTPTGYTQKKAKYRVAPINKNYYDYQYNNEKTNGQDGYAGAFGVSIGKFQIEIK